MTFFSWVVAQKDLRITPYQWKMVELVSTEGPSRLFYQGHKGSKSLIARLYMQFKRETNDKTNLQSSSLSPTPKEGLPTSAGNILRGSFAPRLSIVDSQTEKDGLRLWDEPTIDPRDRPEE